MSIKIESKLSRLEDAAFKQRLERLGLRAEGDRLADGAGRVQGGESALAAAAGADQVLSPQEAARLARTTNVVGQWLGRDATVSERATNTVRSLSMELNGFTAALEGVSGVGEESKRALRRATGLTKSLGGLEGGGTIGKADPDAVAGLGQAVTALAAKLARKLELMQRHQGYLESSRITSGGGFWGAIGAGLAFTGTALAIADLKQNQNLLYPLAIASSDLSSAASATHPTDRLVAEIGGPGFDAGGRIGALMREVDARGKGLTRHDLAEGLDRLLSRHYGPSGPHAPATVARAHADRLAASKDPELRRALANEDPPNLTLGAVMAAILERGASAEKSDRERFFAAIGVDRHYT